MPLQSETLTLEEAVADLENWLSPIASTSIADPNASKTLVARKEVRK